jgi:hypothetical protein
LDQYSGTEIGRRGKEAVAASFDHASSRVVKKNFLRNEDDDISSFLQRIMSKKVLGDPQYSDCAQNLDDENDFKKAR